MDSIPNVASMPSNQDGQDGGGDGYYSGDDGYYGNEDGYYYGGNDMPPPPITGGYDNNASHWMDEWDY